MHASRSGLSRSLGVTSVVAAVLVLVALVFGIRRRIAEPPRPEVRNVLVISLDTTRAGYLSCYGYPVQTTPNIDSVAAEGVVFENAIAPAPLTLPSHATMLTGTIPPHHGVHDNLFQALGQKVQTMPEVLGNAGFSTAAFVSAVVLNRIYALDQGFDTYDDQLGHPLRPSNEQPGDETTRKAIEWLDENHTDRFFLFVHYFDPHAEYAPPPPFAARFRDSPYAGEIAFMDDCVGKLLTRLKELDLYHSTLIVIVGDHGEMLQEHGEEAHGYYVYQSALHVPLIFRLPGQPIRRRVQSIAGVVDVTATVCGLVGVTPPSPQHGMDLWPLMAGRRSPGGERSIYCESLTPTKYLAAPLRGLVGQRWKYIRTTRPELYDLSADPGEQDNIVSSNSEIAERLETQLVERLAGAVGSAETVNLDEETLARLRSLGYVGGSVRPELDDQSGDDPKDLIEFHREYSRIDVLIARRRYAAAEGICHALLTRRPDIPLLQGTLGNVLLKQGRHEEAVEFLVKALELDPADFRAAEHLGMARAALNETDQAIAAYRQAIEIRPDEPRVHYNLAHLYFKTGDVDLALEHATISARLHPGTPAVHTALAKICLEMGRLDEAIDHYYDAVELTPDTAQYLDALARLLATRAEPSPEHASEAIRLATRACELTNYTVARAVDTLAAAQAAGEDFESAIATAEQAISLFREGGHQELAEEAQQRLELYREGRPYREAD